MALRVQLSEDSLSRGDLSRMFSPIIRGWVSDFIENRAVVSPAEAVINLNLKEQTARVLHTLIRREEKIMKMRFGLEDGSERTLEEVGRFFAVTRERIRQIEAKALRKLRQPSRSVKLRLFLDNVHE
ncbi:MAG: sigma factor-like helix-turn-helix DNA-binding protein [Candidatus Sulfotelmatobacter sp.]